MGLLKKIKNGLAVRKLRSIYNKTKRRAVVCNLEQARSVGIIYDATNENDYNIAVNFINNLKSRVPEVYSIGYYSKKINENHINNEFLLFYNKDLNWYGKPKSPQIDKFTNNKFDILIDLKLLDSIPLKFLLVESNSSFKVGRKSEKFPDFYDLMLSLDEKAGLDYFSEQVIVYLNMINNKK